MSRISESVVNPMRYPSNDIPPRVVENEENKTMRSHEEYIIQLLSESKEMKVII
jgi:hypothetical protein